MPVHGVVRRVLSVLACAVVAASLPAVRPSWAQGPTAPGPLRSPAGEPGTAVLGGTVLVYPTAQPAVGAEVALTAQEVPFIRTTVSTDEQGRFAFTSLKAGRYTIGASKPGHVEVAYGQRRPDGPGALIRLAPGERRRIDLQLPRGGVISGMVVDERGEPVLNMQVRATRYGNRAGPRRMASMASAMTDDRGAYRIHSLQPGEYAVCVSPRQMGPSASQRIEMQIESMQRTLANQSGPSAAEARQHITARIEALRADLARGEHSKGYAQTCYPGMSSPTAPSVPVGPAEERSGIDFQLQPIRVARVEGFVLGVAAEHRQRVQVALTPVDAPEGTLDPYNSHTDPDGRFRIGGVPPGRYTLFARTAGFMVLAPGAGTEEAAKPPPVLYAVGDLDVTDSDILHLAVELQPGMTISGQVAFDGTTTTPPPDFSRVRLTLNPRSDARPLPFQMSAQGKIGEGGEFTIENVFPGTYDLWASIDGGPGWSIRSVAVERRDILDEPLHIRPGENVSGLAVTFTDQRNELSGTVTTDRGEPAVEHIVILYPADERYRRPGSRRIRMMRPTMEGRFVTGMVPPGEYRLAAVLDPGPGAAHDPAYLQELDTAALRVTIREGEKQVRNMQVRSAGR